MDIGIYDFIINEKNKKFFMMIDNSIKKKFGKKIQKKL